MRLFWVVFVFGIFFRWVTWGGCWRGGGVGTKTTKKKKKRVGGEIDKSE